MSTLTVRLEGLYITRGQTFPPDPGAHDEPLIARAAVNSLELINCTLDPASYKSIHEDRQPTFVSILLSEVAVALLSPTAVPVWSISCTNESM